MTTLAGSTSGSTGTADGLGTAARFYTPNSIIIDSFSNLFVVDMGTNKIRKVTTYGLVVTFAGTGTASSIDGVGSTATFDSPSGIAADSSNTLYIADSSNYREC